jgi:hypothetical protein
LGGKVSWEISILVDYVEDSPHPFRVSVVRHRPSTGGQLEVEEVIADRRTDRPEQVLPMFRGVLALAAVRQAVQELAGEPTAAGMESAEQVQGLMDLILRRAQQDGVDTVTVLNGRGNVISTLPLQSGVEQVGVAPEVEPDLRAVLLELVPASPSGNVSVILDRQERTLQFRPLGGGAAASAPVATEADFEGVRAGAAVVVPVLPPTAGGTPSLPIAPAARRSAALSSGAQQPAAGRLPATVPSEDSLVEAPANPNHLIFGPDFAGLALLLPLQEVEARIVVDSWEQHMAIREFRGDLARFIVPGYEYDSIEKAMLVAKEALPDATDVQILFLDRQDRSVARAQVIQRLNLFPWEPTLEEALLDRTLDLLGVQRDV